MRFGIGCFDIVGDFRRKVIKLLEFFVGWIIGMGIFVRWGSVSREDF